MLEMLTGEASSVSKISGKIEVIELFSIYISLLIALLLSYEYQPY